MLGALTVIAFVYGGLCVVCSPLVLLLAWYETRRDEDADPFERLWALPPAERRRHVRGVGR